MKFENLIRNKIINFGFEYGNNNGTFSQMDESLRSNHKKISRTFLQNK